MEHCSIKALLRRLQREVFILDCVEVVAGPVAISGFHVQVVDAHTLEVAIEKGQYINQVFEQLGRQGIHVSSMRNKRQPAGGNVREPGGGRCMTLKEQYIAFMTIVRKEIKRYLRIWTQTLLPSAITMSLYFVIFGSLIGSRIGEMGGFTYMQFVVPGLIMMAIVTNSYSNVVSSFLVPSSTTVWRNYWFLRPQLCYFAGLCGGRDQPRHPGRYRRHHRVLVLYPPAHPQLLRGGGYCC